MSFYFSMLAMLLVAITILVLPLLKSRKVSLLAYRESNIRLHEEKLRELDMDLSEGRIDPLQYKVAKQELDRELLGDIPVESGSSETLDYAIDATKKPALAMAVTVFLPAVALLIYMQLGMHAASEMSVSEQSGVETKRQASVEEMTDGLAEKLRNSGGEVEEWLMLGRAYKHLGRYDEAVDAFSTAASVKPNAQIMLEQAEAIALQNGRRFNVKARELVLDALRLEPDNVNALWFAGVVEHQFGNFQKSIEHLSMLSAEAASDAEINKSVRFYLEQSREQLVAAGEKVPTVDELLHAEANVKTELKPGTELRVQVDVSEAVRQKFTASDIVYVYAKAIEGPKMPLAAQRITLEQLPTTVTLDDSMAMVQGMNISAFSSVSVSARVSKSGSAIAESGDYIGETIVSDTSSSGSYKIEIDSLVP